MRAAAAQAPSERWSLVHDLTAVAVELHGQGRGAAGVPLAEAAFTATGQTWAGL